MYCSNQDTFKSKMMPNSRRKLGVPGKSLDMITPVKGSDKKPTNKGSFDSNIWFKENKAQWLFS